jgi:hypothetical protein
MPKRKTSKPRLEDIDALAHLFNDLDFQIEPDDFVLYEVGDLIEQDRASFEDEEFRRIVDLGIHTHVEENLDLRARMAEILRRLGRPAVLKTIHALEDINQPLRNASLVVRTYTSHVFRRLEEIAGHSAALEEAAGEWIRKWQNGHASRETASERLLEIGQPAVGPLAELLFEAPDNRESAELSLSVLSLIRCSSSARVLAYATSEPVLPEDLEIQAYKYLRTLWPLPRNYVLFTASDHSHEDLPFRWFQLVVESDELTAVDLILEEMFVHGGDPDYAEDLKVIVELLRLSRDPEVEEKVVAAMNAAEMAQEAQQTLQQFLANFRPATQPPDNPWSRAEKLQEINRAYRSAADLFEEGKSQEALAAIDGILEALPKYPFAVALRKLISQS